MQVIVLRGLPGSGKSTYAENIKRIAESNKVPKKVAVCSADSFHMVNREYIYVKENAGKAHNQCLLEFHNRLTSPLDILIVDNTNIHIYELAPFYRLPEALGEEVKIVRMHCEFTTAINRNIHRVPSSIIWMMHQALLSERLPSFWKEEIRFSPLP